ncbi:MAG: hypothetical protein ACYS83_07920 [Planctomycetota bacterium]|jgi:hypothetical protein
MNPVKHPGDKKAPISNAEEHYQHQRLSNGMNKPIEQRPPAYRAVITGYGSFAPTKTLTNDELAKMVDTTDEWITTRTGIKVRHIAGDNETTAFLATEAAKRALARADFDVRDLDLIIVATITPEMVPLSSALCRPKRPPFSIYVPPAVVLSTASPSSSSSWKADATKAHL